MYEEYDSTLFLDLFFPPSALAAEVFAAYNTIRYNQGDEGRVDTPLRGLWKHRQGPWMLERQEPWKRQRIWEPESKCQRRVVNDEFEAMTYHSDWLVVVLRRLRGQMCS